MKIELKSNRQWMVVTCLIPTIFLAIAIICLIFAFCFDARGAREHPEYIIIYSIIEMIFISVILIIKFYKGKRYIFSKESIEVYKKDKLINKVSIVDIKNINYVRGKWWSPILEFCSGCVYNTWTLDIELTEGKKLHFGYFSKKDAKRLKDELYGDLITIS